MGKLSNISYKQIVTSFLFVFICNLIVACDVEPPDINSLSTLVPGIQGNEDTGSGGEPPQPENEKISARIHCTDVRRDECSVRVTVNPVTEDVELDIMVHSDYGIQFLPQLDVIPNSDGDGAIYRIRLLTGESRIVDFPYQPRIVSGAQVDGEPDLPGAFKVDVITTHSDTSEVYDHSEAHAFLWLNDFGEFHSLQSPEEYRRRFEDAYVTGSSDLGYAVIMEAGTRPYRGYIWVRADSIKDDYNPILEIKSTGAVVFRDDQVWAHNIGESGTKVTVDFPPINNGGSRVARIPFELDRNGRLLDGSYVFLVKLCDENDPNSEHHETMPVFIQLHSDPQYPNESWLEPVVTRSVPATPTPEGGTGGAFDNVTLMNAENLNKDELCKELENVRFNDAFVRDVHWTREISTFDGTLCEAYLEFVAFRVPMSWGEFQKIMISANENLSSEDELLKPHEMYILPEIDSN